MDNKKTSKKNGKGLFVLIIIIALIIIAVSFGRNKKANDVPLTEEVEETIGDSNQKKTPTTTQTTQTTSDTEEDEANVATDEEILGDIEGLLDFNDLGLDSQVNF